MTASLPNSWARFPSTLWSDIVQARDPQAPEHRHRLEQLLASYWRPVYAFIRRTRGASREQAMDQTQDFFIHLMERDFLARYDRGRGRFRPFLKAELREFLIHEHRRESAAKRGGGERIFSLDGVETVDALVAADTGDPETVFERQWCRDLMNEGLLELRRRLTADGKESWWTVFHAFYMAEGASYVSLGREFHLTEGQVTHYLNFARGLLREILSERIAQYATDLDELNEELRDLLGA